MAFIVPTFQPGGFRSSEKLSLPTNTAPGAERLQLALDKAKSPPPPIKPRPVVKKTV